MKYQNKKWYDLTVASRDNSPVFENGKSAHTVIARVQGKGTAWALADTLRTIYKPEHFIVVVD